MVSVEWLQELRSWIVLLGFSKLEASFALCVFVVVYRLPAVLEHRRLSKEIDLHHEREDKKIQSKIDRELAKRNRGKKT